MRFTNTLISFPGTLPTGTTRQIVDEHLSSMAIALTPEDDALVFSCVVWLRKAMRLLVSIGVELSNVPSSGAAITEKEVDKLRKDGYAKAREVIPAVRVHGRRPPTQPLEFDTDSEEE